MINYTIKRIFEVIPVLLIVSIIVFSVMHLLPGDPTLLMLAGAEGGSIPQERLDELRIIMGLNKPLYEQYYNFISNAISGDLGTSIRLRTPVTEILLQKFPYTIKLSLLGLMIAIFLGVVIGLVAALFKDTWLTASSAMINQQTGSLTMADVTPLGNKFALTGSDGQSYIFSCSENTTDTDYTKTQFSCGQGTIVTKSFSLKSAFGFVSESLTIW